MNKNFLNNQNYILGKTEKKKILSKFFMERKMQDIFQALSDINNYLKNGKYLFVIPLIGVFIIDNIGLDENINILLLSFFMVICNNIFN